MKTLLTTCMLLSIVAARAQSTIEMRSVNQDSLELKLKEAGFEIIYNHGNSTPGRIECYINISRRYTYLYIFTTDYKDSTAAWMAEGAFADYFFWRNRVFPMDGDLPGSAPGRKCYNYIEKFIKKL